MKTLLTLTFTLAALFAAGCESDKAAEKTQPANEAGSQPAQYNMTPNESRVMKLQELDREYNMGGMTAEEYQLRQNEITGLY